MVLEALKKLYEKLNIDSILDDISDDTLTENTARNGRAVLWYLDESQNIAIYCDTLDFLTNEEIENELY